MKYFSLISIFCLFSINNLCSKNAPNSQNNLASFFEEANTFFSNHIIKGAINYEAIQQDSTLNYIIEKIQTANINNEDSLTQTAFLINAYNLNVLAEIVKLLPLNFTVYRETFFSEISVKVAGKKYTFNQFRNEHLAFIATNPLFHFALVQSELSFPMLANYAYKPNKLNEQLEAQTRLVINHTNFLKLDNKKISVPKFLKQYKKDLVGRNGSIIKLINKYYNFDRHETKPIQFMRRIKYTKARHWTLNYYLQATKLNSNETLSKEKLKRQFNKYVPFELLRPGGLEIQLNNNLSKSSLYGYTPNLQYRINSLQSKLGINKTVNLGFLINYEYSSIRSDFELYSVGPQIWIKPFKTKDNFTISSGIMFPLLKLVSNTFFAWPITESDGYAFYGKFNYNNTLGNKFLIDLSLGFSLENVNSKSTQYENLMSVPANVTLHFYINNRLRLYNKTEFCPFKGENMYNVLKGNTYYNQTGLSFICSRKLELSILYERFRQKHNRIRKDDLFNSDKRDVKWSDLYLNFRFSF